MLSDGLGEPIRCDRPWERSNAHQSVGPDVNDLGNGNRVSGSHDQPTSDDHEMVDGGQQREPGGAHPAERREADVTVLPQAPTPATRLENGHSDGSLDRDAEDAAATRCSAECLPHDVGAHHAGSDHDGGFIGRSSDRTGST
jgi:hypothetical protein